MSEVGPTGSLVELENWQPSSDIHNRLPELQVEVQLSVGGPIGPVVAAELD